jgi:predicted DNA-binding protein
MRSRQTMARASIYLGADQHDELRSLSERTGISMAFVVRRGIDTALEFYRAYIPEAELDRGKPLGGLSAGNPATKAKHSNQQQGESS